MKMALDFIREISCENLDDPITVFRSFNPLWPGSYRRERPCLSGKSRLVPFRDPQTCELELYGGGEGPFLVYYQRVNYILIFETYFVFVAAFFGVKMVILYSNSAIIF